MAAIPALLAASGGARLPALARFGRRRRGRATADAASVSRSASVRLAVSYAGFFVLSAVVFMTFMYWTSTNLLERQVEAAVRTDAEALSAQWQVGGLDALMLTIQARLDQDVNDEGVYLLENGDGLRLAGNLERWPKTVQRTDLWYELPISRAGTPALAEMRAFLLPGGDRLLVGRDIRDRDLLRRLLGQTVLYAIAVVCVLSAIGAVVVRNLFRRMVRDISNTATRIAAGDLGGRVPLAGTGDEFDQVAVTINDMLDRMARLMDGVRQVSNAIAHDLRTPITRARSLLEDALVDGRTPDELHAAIVRAVENLDGITKVFEALLRIAEIEAGSRRAAFAPFDLAPVLVNLAEFYAAVAEERDIALDVDVPDRLELNGDRALLQQAVANLLDNALKFSPPNSAVTLAATAEAGVVQLRVSDGGPGIPPADRARAVERFFRGESARSTPGSGLGLSLVQAVVQLHGGELRLEDASPGLRAVLSLPAAAAVARRAA